MSVLNKIPRVFTMSVHGFMSSIFAGGSLFYAIDKEKYWEIPFTIICPSIYTGYNLMKNQSEITQFIDKRLKVKD